MYDQSKSKLLPFLSTHRATGNNDDLQQSNTYVAGERYNNPHVLSEIFPPLQPLREEIKKDKTTDDNICLTRDILRSIFFNALEEKKKLVDATIADAIKIAFSVGIKKGSELGHYLDQTPLGLHQPTEFKAVHLLSPSRTANTGRPSSVINVPDQSVSKLPVNAINSGLDGNKTIHMTISLNTGKIYKRETTFNFSEGSVETYGSFRSQMLGWDDYRTAVELYMSQEGKAAFKVEEVIENDNSTGNVSDMWEALDRAFLTIDHSVSKYRRFMTRYMIQGERMTEYLDELIRLFRKARPDTIVQFQDEDVKTRLLNGLPSEILKEIQGYLDLMEEEIAQNYDLIHVQREALGISSAIIAEKALHVVQEKSVGGVETYTTDDLKHILTCRDVHCQHRFKDESCTYCNKKEHTDMVCFSKYDDEKLTKLAEKISAVMAGKIPARNNEAFESVLNKIEKLNLKG